MIKEIAESFKKEKSMFLISFLIFFAFLGIGLFVGSQFGDRIEKLLNEVLKNMFERILKNVNNKSELFWAILKNNMKVYLLTITIGTLTFGIVSLFVLISNGTLVGLVIPISAKKSSLIKTLLLLLPHGVIEIFAFITGAVASALFLEYLISKKGKSQQELRSVLKRFAILSTTGAGLLVIAAMIEAYITTMFA